MKLYGHGTQTAKIRPSVDHGSHLSLTSLADVMNSDTVKLRPFRHLILLSLFVSPHARSEEIEIQAGGHPRDRSIVTLPARRDTAPHGMLRDSSGTWTPCQLTPEGNLTFITPPLKAGEKRTYTLAERPARSTEDAQAKEEGDQVNLTIAGKAVASYQTVSKKSPRPKLNPLFLRGGYLHPLVTPSGKTVTDDYPVNHLHHHGIWMAWTKTSFDGREPDFWNMGQGKGKVDFVSLEKQWSGPVEAGLVSKQKYTDLTGPAPVDALNETWTVRTYNTGAAFNILDLESSQTTAGNIPLLLPVYHYGGLGIRGLEAWNGKDAATFITSENVTDRNKANGKPARWIAMTGKAGETTAGVAILSHPENFRSPQPVRTHPNEPFISFAPQTNEAMSIQPGETYRAKYRFIIFDGDADAKLIEALWQDYADPVKAVWKD